MADPFSIGQPPPSAAENRRRYPGIRSFERGEAGQFFGREREAQSLFEAVKVKPLTVLFAKSGIGKTSLLNAGLVPMLENDGFLPISIRLQNTDLPPVETVKQALRPFLDESKLAAFGGQPISLQDWVRSCDFGQKEGLAAVPVLIFDQFEELFQHEKSSREALTLELADLLNDRLPEAARARLRAVPMAERSLAMLAWHEPLRLKAIFAIRSDRMSELDQLKNRIPTVLHDRFHLKPLSYENARAAIAEPAALRGTGFWSKPFSYSPEAMAVILESLDNDEGEIESFQLQLLCGFLEQKMMENEVPPASLLSPLTSHTAHISQKRAVKTADFGGAAGIEKILNDYYERELSQFSEAEQTAARRFIEEGLIINGRRVGVPEGAERERFGIDGELLKKLLDSRLLRAENIHLGKIYELSHDTLIEPILSSFEKRKTAENRLRLEAERAAERARLQEALTKRRRARGLAIAGFVLAGLAAVGGFFAFLNGKKAETAAEKAETAALATKAWSVYRDDHTLAFRLAEAAWRLDTTNETALQTLRDIVNEPTTTFYKTVFARHLFEISALVVSPNGQLIASGSLDTDIFIWDKNGQVRHHFPGKQFDPEQSGHAREVQAVAFSHDGQRLFSAGEEGLLKVWNLAGDSLETEWQTHSPTSGLTDMAFSGDGKRLITSGADSTARLWQTDGRLLKIFRGHAAKVGSVAFSPDNQSVITGSDDGTARLWSLDGPCKLVIRLPGIVIKSVAFSPDGKRVALGCNDHSARLFTAAGQPLLTLGGHAAAVSQVLFSPDGRYLLTTSEDHTAKLWTLDGGERLRLVGHTEKVISAAFSPQGSWVVTGSFDFTARIWNLDFNLQNKASRHENYVHHLRFAPDGSYLLSGSADRTVKKWAADGSLLADLRGHSLTISGLDISPDGQFLLTTSYDKTARLWTPNGKPLLELHDFQSAINAARFAPDGQSFLTGDFNGRLARWSVPDGRLLARWTQPGDAAVQSATFSADGQQVFSYAADGFLRAWSLAGDSIFAVETDGPSAPTIAASPDGSELLVAQLGKTAIERRDARTGRLFQKFYGHLNENCQLVWSADGSRFASANWDKTAKIWGKNGVCQQTLSHPDGVYAVAFSPDGKRLATGCRDKIIRLWEVETGRLLGTIGSRQEVAAFLKSAEIAPLAAIPFDWERYSISPNLTAKIYQNNPAALATQASKYLEKGQENEGNQTRCLDYLAEAERIFDEAKRLDAPGRAPVYDSCVAEVWRIRADMFLLHWQFEKSLEMSRAGLRRWPLEYLLVFEVNTLLLGGQREAAIAKARAIRSRLVTQMADYAGMTFGETIQSELEFFSQQYGLEIPDLDGFLAAMNDE